MNQPSAVTIVGASAAGVASAKTLRALGFNGSILLIEAQPHGAYERPPLSKRALQDLHAAPGDFSLLTQEEANSLQIETMFGSRVVDLNTDLLRARLEAGDTLNSDALLLCTGGLARRLPLPGAKTDGIYTLRTFADAVAIRTAAIHCQMASVVGGGLIGAEIVASLVELGVPVCWIDVAPEPLTHALPPKIAAALTDALVSAGVQLRTDAQILRFASENNQVCRIEFENGAPIDTDLVVMGVGMIQDVELARHAGLELQDGGIVVDSDQRTGTKGIFAAGDVAVIRDGSGNHHRTQHWQAAEVQGVRAAHAILGIPCPPPKQDWFWSDQGPRHVEMVGRQGTRHLTRSEESGLAVFEFDGDRLVGAASINSPNSVRAAMQMMEFGIQILPEMLVDAGQDLRRLIRKLRVKEQ